MKKTLFHRELSVVLCVLLAVSIMGSALFSVAAADEPSSISTSSLPETSDPSSADPSSAEPSSSESSSVASGSETEGEEDPSDVQVFPFALGDSAITVSGVTAGGLAAAVTAANGGSGDFSGLLSLTVSGTLQTSDFTLGNRFDRSGRCGHRIAGGVAGTHQESGARREPAPDTTKKHKVVRVHTPQQPA